MAPVKIQGLTRDRISYVRIYGTIDDGFDPKHFLAEAAGRDVILNLKAVTRISSFGVREWVNVLGKLAERADRITFVECSPSVVAQLNMIANFASHARIVSVQVPYYCEGCGWDTEITRELDRDLRTKFAELPPVLCKRCKGVMSFDDDPQTYFAFQQSATTAAPDPTLKAFINDFAKAMGGGESPEAEADQVAAAKPPPRPAAAGSANSAAALGVGPRGSLPSARLSAWVAMALGFGARLQTAWSRSSQRHRLVAVGAAASLAVVLMVLTAATGDDAAGVTPAVTPPAAVVAVPDLRRDRERVLAAFNAKRYSEAIEAGDQLVKMGDLHPDSLWAIGESLRLVGKLPEAALHYETFGREFPNDDRVDDALFWRAEFLATSGDRTGARALYKLLLSEYPSSDLRRSAKKRLASLKKR
jgi:TolA-binding protein